MKFPSSVVYSHLMCAACVFVTTVSVFPVATVLVGGNYCLPDGVWGAFPERLTTAEAGLRLQGSKFKHVWTKGRV